MTLQEQAELSEAARKVGGYSELLRLQDERTAIRRHGKVPKLVKNHQTGHFNYIVAS